MYTLGLRPTTVLKKFNDVKKKNTKREREREREREKKDRKIHFQVI